MYILGFKEEINERSQTLKLDVHRIDNMTGEDREIYTKRVYGMPLNT